MGTEDFGQPLDAARSGASDQTHESKSRSALAGWLFGDYDDNNRKDLFHAIFEYLPGNRIAVCKHHQQGIVKSQLEAHLDKRLKEYVWKTRQKIVKATLE